MVINGIDTKDISVVVQGAVDKEITPLCLASIREHLPGAEIILSTWEGTDVQGLDYDQVLLNKDPGGYDYWNQEYTITGNVNRQVYSTLQGLHKANRRYAVKIRTDYLFESAGFLNWFSSYPVPNKDYSFFRSKIICCDAFSRDPRYKYRLKFLRLVLQPSDFFFFGYTEDLTDLFDIPLMTHEEQVWFARKMEEPVIGLPSFPPEEYLWVKFLQKHLTKNETLPEDSDEISQELIKLTEITFAANLIILSHQQIGIQCGKSALRAKLKMFIGNCYRHKTWLALYKFYCERKSLLYILYRLRLIFVNLFEGFAMKVSDIFIKLKFHSLINRLLTWTGSLKNRLTEEEKYVIRPLSRWIRTGYFKLHGTVKRQKNYVECFFNEDVNDTNLSVMVQGPVREHTVECLKSIRKFLPNAELIFSTWEGSDTSNLDYDKLVFSKDPGECGLVRYYPHPQSASVNRIIVSSFAGIRVASRRYCLRLRSDIILTSTDFLNYYNQFSTYIGQNAMVSRRIMVDGLATSKELLFDVSDWWQLGLTSDLYRLYDIPLYPNEDVPYFRKEENKRLRPLYSDLVIKKITEQYVIDCFIKKYGDYSTRSVEFEHTYDRKPECVELYKRFIAENLLCIEMDKTGIFLPKCENMRHPAQYCATLPGGTWLDYCHAYGTLPAKLTSKDLIENLRKNQQIYNSNPRYYGVEVYANVVKNYAHINSIAFPEGVGEIDPSEITFVVSGETGIVGDLNAHHCLISIRRFFPTSYIIISTWEGEPVERLTGLYDQLVLLPKGRNESQFFIDRQQRCVHRGMQEVKTKYAVRMRPDHYLYNDHFLTFYKKWTKALCKRESDYVVFKERVLALRVFTFDPRSAGRAFSLSDRFLFGRTEDMLELWDGHQEHPGTFTYFDRQPSLQTENPDGFHQQYTAEQYLFLNVLRKVKPELPYPRHYFDVSDDCFAFETEKVYASNVLIGGNGQLGIACDIDERYISGIYSLERLMEIYLFNVEPDNQQCLSHLKIHYAPQAAIKRPPLVIWFHLIFRVTRSLLCELKRGMKCVMRTCLPFYRVSAGTRDRLLGLETLGNDRFNCLNYKLDILAEEQRKNEDEIRRLRTQLSDLKRKEAGRRRLK